MRERFDIDALDPDDPFEIDRLMIARLPEAIVLVPLAPPTSGDARKCRPIGIYEPRRGLIERYEEDSRS